MTASLCAVEDHSLRHLARLSRSQREQLVETYGKPRHEYLRRRAERRAREVAARSRKEAQQRRRFDLMSAGASLATLIDTCISDSGMFFMYESCGGSAESMSL